MVIFLRILFLMILVSMLLLTVTAFRERPLTEAFTELWSDAWFKLTAAEAYFGLIAIYVWVAYKERRLHSKLMWFVLFMGLGNTAVAVYVLNQLFRLPSGSSVEALLVAASNDRTGGTS